MKKTLHKWTGLVVTFIFLFLQMGEANAFVGSSDGTILEKQLGNTNCFILLEPVSNEIEDSPILEIQCGLSDHALNSKILVSGSYRIVRFYDNTNFDNLIINILGTTQCSSSSSYRVSSLSADLDNRISSANGYSGCNNISVYDRANYSGDSFFCQYSCSSFGSMNDRVSSWKVTN